MGSLASSIEYQTKPSLIIRHHNHGLRTAILVNTRKGTLSKDHTGITIPMKRAFQRRSCHFVAKMQDKNARKHIEA